MAVNARPSTFATVDFSILEGSGPHSATFVLGNEDHTLGNALRYVLLKRPETVFCGYSVPHPSEPIVHVRLQVLPGGPTANEVFKSGLKDLISICNTIGERIPGGSQSDAPPLPDR
jgi:DNA-directed RNA polymerase I and III subunit RPAC2